MTQMRPTNNGLLVTGTDTDVGKTYVACLIARELRAQGTPFQIFKPACSGAVQDDEGNWSWPDLTALSEAAGVEDQHAISPQRFRAPLAPHMAAAEEDRSVDVGEISNAYQQLSSTGDFVLTEGVGGLLCPLAPDFSVADFASEINVPLLIVARVGLGTLNHILLTVEVAKSRGLTIAGILFSDSDNSASDPSSQTNPQEIARLTQQSVADHQPVLGILPHGSNQILDVDTKQPKKIVWIDLLNG
jgi:dethiobiotin synthetase